MGQKFVIDRNTSTGSIKGEEEVTFAVDKSDLTRNNHPVLKLKVRMENNWFCPQ